MRPLIKPSQRTAIRKRYLAHKRDLAAEAAYNELKLLLAVRDKKSVSIVPVEVKN